MASTPKTRTWYYVYRKNGTIGPVLRVALVGRTWRICTLDGNLIATARNRQERDFQINKHTYFMYQELCA